MALSLESSDAKAEFYGIQEILLNRVFTQEELYDKIEKVKAVDILRVAKKMFMPSNLNLVVLGPFKDKRKFQKLLS